MAELFTSGPACSVVYGAPADRGGKGTMGASARQEIDRILEALDRQGWRIRRGTKHIMVYPADKRFPPLALPSTPSDHRSLKNTVADLRRRGAIL
jgi:hypothetical protein